jgi:hypothetical protein
MLRRLIAATATVAGAVALALAAVVPAHATTNSNDPAYWQTPGTNEVCSKIEDPGGTTWTLPAAPAGSVWTKVIIKAGSTGTSVDAENNAYYSDSTYKYPADDAGTTWNQVADLQSTTFSHPSGKDISHVIFCSAPVPPTEVSGAATATDQVCSDGRLVDGVITVTVKDGVTYTITGPSGSVPFDAVTGKTAALPAGAYTVTVTATTGYVLDGPSSIALTIHPYSGACGEQNVVTPSATATDQVCTQNQLVNGIVTVAVKDGVAYTITGPSGSVPFDAVTGQTTPLSPGTYTVHPTAQSGFTLTDSSDIVLTVHAYVGDCVQLETDPLVDPSAAMSALTCSAAGSYTLTSDQEDPEAVIWTVNGSPVSAGVHTVSSAGTYHVHAAPAPGYGFGEHTVSDWTFTFTEPASCELKTLALTGAEDPTPFVVLAGLLGLIGVAMVRAARRGQREA